MLTVRVKRVPGAPVVAARIWLAGGARFEEIPGQSYLTGRLLTEGSRRRSWDRIALEAEDRGMVVQSAGVSEALALSIDALAEDADLALEWLAELAFEPAFPEDRFQWSKRQAVAELEGLKDLPEVCTARAFLEQLYHPHPYCRPAQGDEASLERLTPQDCIAFHRRSLGWGGCVVVTGDIDEEAIESRLAELLDDPRRGNSGDEPRPAVPVPRTLDPAASSSLEPGEGHRQIELADVEQAYLYAGHLTVPRHHPQMVALDAAAVILGAGAGLSGRLPTRIREREGLAYAVDVATAAGAGLDAGRLVAYAGTAPETVARAESSMREELARFVEEGPEDDELEEARSYLLGREPFRRETARQWADVLAEAEFYGLPSDRPKEVAARLKSLTRDEVEEAIREWIRPEELRVTVGMPAGD